MINPNQSDFAADFERVLDGFDPGRQVDDLYTVIMDAAWDAARHKVACGVQDRMERARRAINNEYNPDELSLLDDNCVYMGLTNLKVRAFRSWVSDILLNSEDRPFTVQPTPIPDLPRAVEDTIIDAFLDEVQEQGFIGDIEVRLSELKQIARGHVDRATRVAAGNLENLIADQLTEGNWREAFDEFIDDLGSMPGAVLKGPHVHFDKQLQWREGKANVVQKTRFRLSRVSPFDIFPSSDSRCPQSGRYMVERMRMGQTQLLDASNMGGFRPEAIRAAIDDNPSGWAWESNKATAQDTIEDVDYDTHTSSDTGGLYEVLVYYGQLRGSLLMDMGVADLDPQRAYETEVWITGGQVVRAILNPHPLGKRPYFMTSFDKQPGSFWGKGLPDLLADVQRVGNAAIRAMIKNMAFSAGPIGEADMSRLTGEDDVTEVMPFRIYQVDNDTMLPSAQPALRFHNILSNSRELMEIYERFMKQADDISGIPAYVLGNPQVAGAGRTLGGLSLLMGNAAKGIKKVISHVDKDVIEPMVGEYAAFNMLFNDNPDIKFDSHVVARGSTGLLQQELSQSRAVELLGLLSPYLESGIVPERGLQVVMRDVIRGLGYRADEIVPDPSRPAELGNFLRGQAAPPAAIPSAQPGTPPPALDGRSGPALDAIATGV